jgi:enoyl-CoA hydratase/carnithine racemase
MTMLQRQPGHVTILTLERPPANALDRAFFVELADILAQLRDDPAVGAVVLTGSGRFFSAGLDLFAVFAGDAGEFRDFTVAFDAGFSALFGFPKPLVAAVNGHAIAGGVVLAAAADLRLLADGEAKLGLTEILVGVPFPRSALEIVRHACAGPDLPEVLYHGRTYPPRKALARRLADTLVPSEELLSRARGAAAELASRPPKAFAGIKEALRREALARIAAYPPGDDPTWGVWRDPATLAAVEAFRTRTLRGRGRG